MLVIAAFMRGQGLVLYATETHGNWHTSAHSLPRHRQLCIQVRHVARATFGAAAIFAVAASASCTGIRLSLLAGAPPLPL